MTDIELIREAAEMAERVSIGQMGKQLRALADRLEAQSKAEPSAWMAEDGRLCSPATKKCAMHKSTAEQFNIPLFTHADAGEVEGLKARVAGLEAILARCSDVNAIKAKRYDWLRKKVCSLSLGMGSINTFDFVNLPRIKDATSDAAADLDAAIDAAIVKVKP